MKRVLITGSSGLIGSEAVLFFDRSGWTVHGMDNNMRMQFLGPDGDTRWVLDRLNRTARRFTHHEIDIRARAPMLQLLAEIRPDLLVHCAAQPSHDVSTHRPFEDFEVNATGTLNLLEGARRFFPESPFIYMSTNKVYGDAPNRLPLRELDTRYDYANPEHRAGIDESRPVDAGVHTLYGVSKLAGDLLVQEYGRCFGLPTVCLRAGCITGPNHSGAELHGFLAYMALALREGRTYRIRGHKGKQVRDNLHSYDVCTAFLAFYESPRPGAVYNLGGGRANSVSVLEAIDRFERLAGGRLKLEYDERPRTGDHICYITNLSLIQGDYPAWKVTRSLDDIFSELAGVSRLPSP